MKKRVRKKRHLGEFREWGVPLAVRRTHPEGFDDFTDDFIEQAIEAQGLFFGGVGQGERFSGVIEVGRIGDPIEARVRHVRDWLDARTDVAQYVMGPLVDLWHGPFYDLDTIDERLPATAGPCRPCDERAGGSTP
jgi:uncharacterized protein YggL (DUF469 family)